jgi:predicted ATPase
MRSNHDYRKTETNESSGYFLSNQPDWEKTCAKVLGELISPRILKVYSRSIPIPLIGSTGAAKFDFSELCGRNLGPADYITIASTFPIIILDNVPTLTLIKKNEARRFIILLDTLYESRVKLLIRASSPADQLFFPDADTTENDLLWTESYTKAQLDMTTPYRPNVSSYTGGNKIERIVSLVDCPVDSSKLTAFTGEDERFAFQRAVSRLYEMPSKKWWETQIHSPVKELAWTGEQKGSELTKMGERKGSVENVGERDLEFRHAASPFRVSLEKPPTFFDGHFWGVIRWGRKAGRWGMGISSFYFAHLGTDAFREKEKK